MRRRFLDIAISQLRPAYCHLLDRYSKTLEQRNNLLRKIKYEKFSRDTLFIWNEKLAEYGEQIIKYRLKYASEISGFAQKIHSEICSDRLCVSYKPKCRTREELTEKLESDVNREIEQGFTLYGPHRDDILITVSGNDAKLYASQGQQRTAVLSLKLAQSELIFSETGERPVLLLDDIMSELKEELLMHELSKKLPPRTMRIVKMKVRGDKMHEIAKAERLTFQEINRLLDNIYPTVRKIFYG